MRNCVFASQIGRRHLFDRAKWTKLMQIVKETGIDWRERRLIRKLYVDQRAEV